MVKELIPYPLHGALRYRNHKAVVDKGGKHTRKVYAAHGGKGLYKPGKVRISHAYKGGDMVVYQYAGKHAAKYARPRAYHYAQEHKAQPCPIGLQQAKEPLYGLFAVFAYVLKVLGIEGAPSLRALGPLLLLTHQNPLPSAEIRIPQCRWSTAPSARHVCQSPQCGRCPLLLSCPHPAPSLCAGR